MEAGFLRKNGARLAGLRAGVQGHGKHGEVSEAHSRLSLCTGLVGKADMVFSSFWARSDARTPSQSQRWQSASVAWPQRVTPLKKRRKFAAVHQTCYRREPKPLPTSIVGVLNEMSHFSASCPATQGARPTEHMLCREKKRPDFPFSG